ncbi:rhodanese-related sulfurtransferase [Salsuginibacillus halophilus]|uniref:Rhodanese-related sulfurtransferase n=1 Tax=Salsuginibacillus halophilus TaxID=517424 RepID=A0A2P8H7Z5_9BACI|nr:rhodanese-like domain-containing protein [Salsuginibacillus halophilus]PSL42355.1 rhodanese-related sulfurtransferase [Salsuginibacillus halophilus]
MDIFTLILWGLLIGFIGFMLYRRLATPKYLTEFTPSEFRENYRKAQIIDVREPREYNGGHILGARNIPLSQMKQRLNEIRTDQPVYLYCQSGARSRQAARLLKKKHGHEDLNHLKKGFKRWDGKIKQKK